MGTQLFPRTNQAALRQGFIERWAENDRQAYLASLASVSQWSLEDRLDSIGCPTCLLSGEYDFFPLELKQAYVAKLPDVRLVVIPGSGHFSPLDEPMRFNEAAMTFLVENC